MEINIWYCMSWLFGFEILIFVLVDLVVMRNLKYVEEDVVFIYCGVGDRVL